MGAAAGADIAANAGGRSCPAYPQWGQAGAWEDIGLPHSGHGTRAMGTGQFAANPRGRGIRGHP
jgi:hypothetical protein